MQQLNAANFDMTSCNEIKGLTITCKRLAAQQQHSGSAVAARRQQCHLGAAAQQQRGGSATAAQRQRSSSAAAAMPFRSGSAAAVQRQRNGSTAAAQ